MEATGYAWWVARLPRQLKQVDLIRLDHFRGFAQAWHIPATEKTAREREVGGRPRRGAVRAAAHGDSAGCRSSPRTWASSRRTWTRCARRSALPGMRVLQFALERPDEPALAAQLRRRTASCYTGTHDNDTDERLVRDAQTTANGTTSRVPRPAGRATPAWDLIRAGVASVAAIAVAPLQDVLSLGSEARMNMPGVADRELAVAVPAGPVPPGSDSTLRGTHDAVQSSRRGYTGIIPASPRLNR